MSQHNQTMALALMTALGEEQSDDKAKLRRFDIFKGRRNSEGKIEKIRSVGSARIAEGLETFIIELKTLLSERYYMLPEKNLRVEADYAILTRESSSLEGRKYFWSKVGEGVKMIGINEGLLHLSWDLLVTDDVFLNLAPMLQPANSVAS